MFKGKTTAGYNSKTGKQLGTAKTAGRVGGNVRSTGNVLPGSKTNVVTKQTMKGVNPRNTRTQTQNTNRVQRAGGPKTNPKQVGVQRAANIASPATRGKQSMSRDPFGGYQKLANTRNVPAGKGNIRNAGTVTHATVAKQKAANLQKMPKGAISGSKSFGSFIGRN